jgi:hypothetical protein
MSWITTISKFKLPRAATPKQARALFLEVAPKFKEPPGLMRKQFLLSEDGTFAGGVLPLEGSAQCRGLYSQRTDWHDPGALRRSARHRVFHSPVIVDNESGDILS